MQISADQNAEICGKDLRKSALISALICFYKMIFTDPLTNLKQFGLRPTDNVADLGAGSGAYTIPAAQMVREGKVYAIEIQKDLLLRIKDEASKAFLSNVETIWGDIELVGGTKLKDGIIDAVIISSVLFQAENKISLVQEASRILKLDGRVLLIDWNNSFGGIGPRSDMIISADAAKILFENAGLKFEKEIHIDEYHYGLIFKK